MKADVLSHLEHEEIGEKNPESRYEFKYQVNP